MILITIFFVICFIFYFIFYFLITIRNKKTAMLMLEIISLIESKNMRTVLEFTTEYEWDNFKPIKLKDLNLTYNKILYSFKKIKLENYISNEMLNYLKN